MLQCHPSERTTATFLRNTKSSVILARKIFDGPMDHVTSSKVKTNMFLIWCGPDRENIYDNLELEEDEMYDIDHIMEQFELYCELICNFCATRYKFHQVSHRENETTNAFYHCIQKLCVQCQFSDDEEHLVDVIIHGTRVHKAREKLLQMLRHLTLHDCFKICHHYESLQYHLNVVKPTDKPVESITKHRFNRSGKQSSARTKKTSMFRGQSNTKPVNSANNMAQCSNCGTTHPKHQCPAYRVTCFKCNRIGHYATECRANSSSRSTQKLKAV